MSRISAGTPTILAERRNHFTFFNIFFHCSDVSLVRELVPTYLSLEQEFPDPDSMTLPWCHYQHPQRSLSLPQTFPSNTLYFTQCPLLYPSTHKHTNTHTHTLPSHTLSPSLQLPSHIFSTLLRIFLPLSPILSSLNISLTFTLFRDRY